MGRHKALASHGGTSLVHSMQQRLLQGGCHPVFAVGKSHQELPPDVSTVYDTEEDHHPLFGVASALSAASGPLVLIVACDLIALTVPDLKVLLAQGRSCVAWDGARVHPLLAVLETSRSQEARQRARRGDAAHSLVAMLPRVALTPASLLDANHPAQLSNS